MLRKILLIFFSILIINIYAQKNEIHVSITGNDLNEGTILSPLKSISQAAKKAMPGDVIIVHEGIYREQITPTRGGNSDQERII